jgi:hypothetical protein
VALGTVHFAEPRAARRILAEVDEWCAAHDIASVGDLTGSVTAW